MILTLLCSARRDESISADFVSIRLQAGEISAFSRFDLDLRRRFLGAQLRQKWSGALLKGTVRSVVVRGIGRHRLFID